MQFGLLLREIEQLDQSHWEKLQRDQAKFEVLENKLGESRLQCSNLEATNAKQAEEIAELWHPPPAKKQVLAINKEG